MWNNDEAEKNILINLDNKNNGKKEKNLIKILSKTRKKPKVIYSYCVIFF